MAVTLIAPTMDFDTVELLSKYLNVSDLARLCCAEQGMVWPEIFERRQLLLARQMEANVKTGDSWGWIFPPLEQCSDPCQRQEGTVARFIMRRAGWSVFRDLNSFSEFDPARQGTYLIHDDDLRILWVGSGTNANGGWLSGITCDAMVLQHLERVDLRHAPMMKLCSGGDIFVTRATLPLRNTIAQ